MALNYEAVGAPLILSKLEQRLKNIQYSKYSMLPVQLMGVDSLIGSQF